MSPHYITRPRSRVKSAAEIIERLGGDPHTGMCRCPAHRDERPSLHVDVSDSGATLVHCFAGCTQDAVIAALRALGLWWDTSLAVNVYDAAPRSTSKRSTEDKARDILRTYLYSEERPVEYLRSRGITLVPEALWLIPISIASKVGLPFFPHMVARIVDQDGNAIGAQVTILTKDAEQKADSKKGPRRTFGR